MTMKTPLKRVLGLGSARAGTGHFWHQRVTAVANLILVTIGVIVVVSLVGQPYETVRAALGSPLVGILILALLLSALYHMKLGMQVVIEDYVHGPARLPLLIANVFFAAAVGLASVWAVIQLSLGG